TTSKEDIPPWITARQHSSNSSFNPGNKRMTCP
ncbi:MAG: hypothetical protein ACI93T_003533, partial [Porticoccaceae bacterium]